ncbi:MAG: hypothetical protein QM504_15110, partial [Pseudomonadota bacterium]
MKDKKLQHLITTLRLPEQYTNYIPLYFEPIVEKIYQLSQQVTTPIIGINGSQGSGKTTAAIILQYLLESKYKFKVAVLSIDDFYYSKAKRNQLAASIHPLF